jgi:hypothetical protein
MKTWLMVIIGALILGFAFAGSSYFVTREQDVLFQCYYDSTVTTNKTFNTYKISNYGFPVSFYSKYSKPLETGCQKPEFSDKALSYDAHGNIVPFAQFNKMNFAKDFALWSGVFLVLGIFIFGVKKKQ